MVKVTLLRRRGKRIKLATAESEQQYLGEVRSHWFKLRHIATMRTGQPADEHTRLPPDLYEPTFESIIGRQVRILGFESAPDATYAQEWKIEFI